MTIFFLVVGIEIRREIHEGSLSDIRQAMLPLAAASVVWRRRRLFISLSITVPV
jgi:Na+/H+ antiporter NhaA